MFKKIFCYQIIAVISLSYALFGMETTSPAQLENVPSMQFTEPTSKHVPEVTITEIVNNTNKTLILSLYDLENNQAKKLLEIPPHYKNNKLGIDIPMRSVFMKVPMKMGALMRDTIMEFNNKYAIVVHDKDTLTTNTFDDALLNIGVNQQYHPWHRTKYRQFTYSIYPSAAETKKLTDEQLQELVSITHLRVFSENVDYKLSIIFEGDDLVTKSYGELTAVER